MIRTSKDFVINLDDNLKEEYLIKFNNIIKDCHIIVETQELKYDINNKENEYYKCIDKNVFELIDSIKIQTEQEIFDLNRKLFKLNQKLKFKRILNKIIKIIKGEKNNE